MYALLVSILNMNIDYYAVFTNMVPVRTYVPYSRRQPVHDAALPPEIMVPEYLVPMTR